MLRSTQGGTLVDAVARIYCADEAQRLLRSLTGIVCQGGIQHHFFAPPHPHNKNIQLAQNPPPSLDSPIQSDQRWKAISMGKGRGSAAFFYFCRIIMYKVTIETTPETTDFAPTVPLLSELYIQLPKPQTPRKVSTVPPPDNLDYDFVNPGIGSGDAGGQQLGASRKLDSNYYNISSGRTKNSSSTMGYRTESEIIHEWVRSLFQKKNLLGIQWEQKIATKRKDLLRQAWKCLKEDQEAPSEYLQTQSKHKPYLRKQNHLVALGTDKMAEIADKWKVKVKRMAFSKVLRFIAFRQMVNPQSKSESKFETPSKISLKETKLVHELKQRELSASKPNAVKNSNILNPIKNEDYEVKPTHSKQPQSAQQLPYADNEYALAPVSPIKIHHHDRKYEHPLEPRINERLIQSKSSTNMANSKPLSPGNVKYQFNQHNYIVIQEPKQPRTTNVGDSRYMPASPPSPIAHYAQTIKFVTPTHFHPPFPDTLIQSTRTLERPPIPIERPPNYMRPHSHNPFITVTNHPAPTGQPDTENKKENRKSRAISSSPNIKISFMGREMRNVEGRQQKMSDYEGDPQKIAHQPYKLGTLENRRMRQSYQVDSCHNELIPHDLPKTPQTPQAPLTPQAHYFYSTPASPKPQEPVYRQQQFGRQSYMPTRNEIPPELRQSMQPEVRQSVRPEMKQSVQVGEYKGEYNMRRVGGRQKITVTSAQKVRMN